MLDSLKKTWRYITKKIIRRTQKILVYPRQLAQIQEQLYALQDIVLLDNSRVLQKSLPNPLNHFGQRCFSQNDEDGITLEIVRRLGIQSHGTYAEFGVGDGTENNTLILAALGWKGFWVGGESLAFNLPVDKAAQFTYLKAWVTLDNILDLTAKGVGAIDAKTLDVISLDLDGNDLFFVQALLGKGYTPKLFIVEYNAKFPPPVRFTIAYNPKHEWQYDDYQGASLASFDEVFKEFGYRLVCCNAHNGGNAFFVREEFSGEFSDVPTDINQLYVPPRYYHTHKYGHAKSIKTVVRVFDIESK